MGDQVESGEQVQGKGSVPQAAPVSVPTSDQPISPAVDAQVLAALEKPEVQARLRAVFNQDKDRGVRKALESTATIGTQLKRLATILNVDPEKLQAAERELILDQVVERERASDPPAPAGSSPAFSGMTGEDARKAASSSLPPDTNPDLAKRVLDRVANRFYPDGAALQRDLVSELALEASRPKATDANLSQSAGGVANSGTVSQETLRKERDKAMQTELVGLTGEQRNNKRIEISSRFRNLGLETN